MRSFGFPIKIAADSNLTDSKIPFILKGKELLARRSPEHFAHLWIIAWYTRVSPTAAPDTEPFADGYVPFRILF